MIEDELLTIDGVAAATGLPKRQIRLLVRTGRLPASRLDGRWRVHRADLAQLSIEAGTDDLEAAATATIEPVEAIPAIVAASQSGISSDYPGGVSQEFNALVDVLKRRDEQIVALQDERVRLAGLVGYFQAQVADRDARLRLLEAAAIETPSAQQQSLPAMAGGAAARDAGSILSANLEPALHDQDAKVPTETANETNTQVTETAVTHISETRDTLAAQQRDLPASVSDSPADELAGSVAVGSATDDINSGGAGHRTSPSWSLRQMLRQMFRRS